ncbi:hypothetical protein F4811DRAFT_475547 [Daldinia bambusicola]|nr:hypothetical protein F4811DRAFT_475547 [Daldinia bambusicola]
MGNSLSHPTSSKTSSKRKADEISTDENEKQLSIPTGPARKEAKTDKNDPKPWEKGMEIPLGKPRPRYNLRVGNSGNPGDFEERKPPHRSGRGTTENPAVIWLVKPRPLSRVAIEAAVKEAAQSIGKITHIYIRSRVARWMFFDRDWKKVFVQNYYPVPASYAQLKTNRRFVSVGFGTTPDNLVLYGFVYVRANAKGHVIGLDSVQKHSHAGDKKVLELFEYKTEPLDCGPYCPRHARDVVPIDMCKFKGTKSCPFHSTANLLDHYCRLRDHKAKTNSQMIPYPRRRPYRT